ncbi:hypothetical protein ACOSP7_011626 [Xanthoceras sorbifolium]
MYECPKKHLDLRRDFDSPNTLPFPVMFNIIPCNHRIRRLDRELSIVRVSQNEFVINARILTNMDTENDFHNIHGNHLTETCKLPTILIKKLSDLSLKVLTLV